MTDYIPPDRQLMYAIGGELQKFERLEAFDALNALFDGDRRVVPGGHLPGDAELWEFKGKGLLYEPGNHVLMRMRHNVSIHTFHGLERNGVKPEHNGIFIARGVFPGLNDDQVGEALAALPKTATFTGPVFPFSPNAEGVFQVEQRAFPVEVAGRSLHGRRGKDGQMDWMMLARLVPLYH